MKRDSFAFPVASATLPNEAVEWGHPGMTYREWLIGQALAGATASADEWKPEELITYVDRVIAAMEKPA